MNPIFYILFSMVAYAIGNHAIERHCSQYAAAVTTSITSFVILVISLGVWLHQWHNNHGVSRDNLQLEVQSIPMLLILLGLGVILWAGDFFSFVGYANGASAFTVSTMMLLIAVFVSVIDHVTEGGWPSPGLCAGYCFTAIGSVLVAIYGNPHE